MGPRVEARLIRHGFYPRGGGRIEVDIAPAPLTANDKAWSLAANLFWSPVKALDLGVEYRHGERELLNGLAGQLNRLEFAAKYNF